jgi:hypothetical protein
MTLHRLHLHDDIEVIVFLAPCHHICRGEKLFFAIFLRKINKKFPFSGRHRFNSRHRHQMTDDDEDDDDTDENFTETNYMEEHYHNYMAERERLQEFPGRVPHQRKRKATDSEHNPQQQQQQQCEGREDKEEEVKNKPKVRENDFFLCCIVFSLLHTIQVY